MSISKLNEVAVTTSSTILGVSGLAKVWGQALASGSSSLLTDLAAYWKLDEASGTRVDSTANAQDVAETGTVASATGILSNGADIEFGTAAYLSHADSATLSLGADTDFTFSCWVKLESETGWRGGIIAKNGGDDNTDEYLLEYEASGIQRWRFKVANGTSSQTVAWGSQPSTATWYHIMVWHDSANDQIALVVNNGTPVTAAWTGGTQNGTAGFYIGTMSYNQGFRFDGIIDEVGFWKRLLTADEKTTLYNGGTGLSYPF